MKHFFRLLLAVCLVSAFCIALGVPVFANGRSLEAEGAQPTRILLLGCDQSAALSDTILLITADPAQHRISALQIPRDTYAHYSERSYKKLNGALSVLKAEGVRSFLSDALGVPIQFFLVLQLETFTALVDAVGGVEVEIPEEMHYDDPAQALHISLPKGRVRLNGAQAEQFVRFRAGYANADIGRLEAQKQFLRSFARQCAHLSTAQLMHVLFLALTGVQTNIGIQSAFSLVAALRDCNAEQMEMSTLPGEAARGTSGAWYYVINRKGAWQTVNALLFPKNALAPEEFDPHGVFDRADNTRFHRIYSAEPEELPLGDP